jgi:hypothetical protein
MPKTEADLFRPFRAVLSFSSDTQGDVPAGRDSALGYFLFALSGRMVTPTKIPEEPN